MNSYYKNIPEYVENKTCVESINKTYTCGEGRGYGYADGIHAMNATDATSVVGVCIYDINFSCCIRKNGINDSIRSNCGPTDWPELLG